MLNIQDKSFWYNIYSDFQFNPPFFSGYYLTSDRDVDVTSGNDADKDQEVVAKCKLSMKVRFENNKFKFWIKAL